LSQPAIKVICSQDGPRIVYYCDPHYLQSTRSARHAYGSYEMSDARRLGLSRVIVNCGITNVLSKYYVTTGHDV
jgi:hypothetical protein